METGKLEELVRFKLNLFTTLMVIIIVQAVAEILTPTRLPGV